MSKALLVLSDGVVFEGEGFGSEGETIAEVVFNTSMTGYQEILTDSSYKGQITALQGDVASYKSQVTSLQTDISSYKSQVASLQSQLQSSASGNISALQDQVLSLLVQNQDLTDISKLTKVSVKADQVAINQSGRGLPVAKFTADYAGYVLVSGQSTASDSYITVEDSFPGYPLNTYNYPFGTSATLVIPVLPGTITVTYGIPISGGASTGTISVRYYY